MSNYKSYHTVKTQPHRMTRKRTRKIIFEENKLLGNKLRKLRKEARKKAAEELAKKVAEETAFQAELDAELKEKQDGTI